ncbi:hypothetical protein ACFE04_027763 [Oxalis oulophora]
MKTKGPKSSCWEEIIPSLVYELRPPPYLIADGASVTGGRDRKFARRARPLTQPAAQWDRSLAQATTVRAFHEIAESDTNLAEAMAARIANNWIVDQNMYFEGTMLLDAQ